jgi:hypothetical protein
VDVGEPMVAAPVTERQLFVVEDELVQGEETVGSLSDA